MQISNYTAETLLIELRKRLTDISQRERIVLTFPFGSDCKRIEIYCGESECKSSGYLGGKTFDGIVSITSYYDYNNTANEKSSYSYQNELLNYLPTLTSKIFNSLKPAVNS